MFDLLKKNIYLGSKFILQIRSVLGEMNIEDEVSLVANPEFYFYALIPKDLTLCQDVIEIFSTMSE